MRICYFSEWLAVFTGAEPMTNYSSKYSVNPLKNGNYAGKCRNRVSGFPGFFLFDCNWTTQGIDCFFKCRRNTQVGFQLLPRRLVVCILDCNYWSLIGRDERWGFPACFICHANKASVSFLKFIEAGIPQSLNRKFESTSNALCGMVFELFGFSPNG